MNKISDLNENNFLKVHSNISELRRHTNILIIDDNKFPAESYLTTNGYQIQHKDDIDAIIDVQPYEIIMCDISGVGKKLGYDKEGARIIKEIHLQYPNKRVIAYTSNTYNADYNKYFSLADYVAPKDIGVDDWIDILDEQVRNVISPISQWKKIRNWLLENEVSTIKVAQIEDKFVKAVKRKDFEIVKRYINTTDSKFSSVISDFASSLCAKIILGAITGGA
ncbi:MAG: hypothetical protein E7491_06755 [Ruminococcaceae bacterium]|nr:hypothetical protein [Oscillospiraceae bacterium]